MYMVFSFEYPKIHSSNTIGFKRKKINLKQFEIEFKNLIDDLF